MSRKSSILFSGPDAPALKALRTLHNQCADLTDQADIMTGKSFEDVCTFATDFGELLENAIMFINKYPKITNETTENFKNFYFIELENLNEKIDKVLVEKIPLVTPVFLKENPKQCIDFLKIAYSVAISEYDKHKENPKELDKGHNIVIALEKMLNKIMNWKTIPTEIAKLHENVAELKEDYEAAVKTKKHGKPH